MGKPILCLDFDGVIHSYTSGWKGADVIPDPPVDGALSFINNALNAFQICILSSRSHQTSGIFAMQKWLKKYWTEQGLPEDRYFEISWPTEKPAAFLTIDDRALTFTGVWPDIQTLREFKPWNKP